MSISSVPRLAAIHVFAAVISSDLGARGSAKGIGYYLAIRAPVRWTDAALAPVTIPFPGNRVAPRDTVSRKSAWF